MRSLKLLAKLGQMAKSHINGTKKVRSVAFLTFSYKLSVINVKKYPRKLRVTKSMGAI